VTLADDAADVSPLSALAVVAEGAAVCGAVCSAFDELGLAAEAALPEPVELADPAADMGVPAGHGLRQLCFSPNARCAVER
jgi:hypothetical protein